MVIKDGFCLYGIFGGSRIQLLWHFLSTLNKQDQRVSSQHVCVVSGASAGPRVDDGRLYRFGYTTELGVNRPKGLSRGNAGFKTSSHVDISLSWRNPENPDEQLLRLQVRRTRSHTAHSLYGFTSNLDGREMFTKRSRCRFCCFLDNVPFKPFLKF